MSIEIESTSEAGSTSESSSRTAGTRMTRAPWRDGVATGIAAVVVGALGLMAVYEEVFVDALVFLAVLATLGVFAVRSGSRALRWVIAALMTLFVGINAVYAAGDLSHPESPGPFIATVVIVLSGVTTMVLAVAAARGRTAHARRVWVGVGVAVAIASLGSIVAAAFVSDDVAEPGDVTIVAEDATYPVEVVAASGTEGLLLSNQDSFRHDFVIDGVRNAVELPAATDVRITVDDLAPGTYRFFCSIPGHDMEGRLIVR